MNEPFAIIAEPSPVQIDESDSITRIRSRQEQYRDESYDSKYDFKTVFYDCIISGQQLLLPGPPLMNFDQLLEEGKLTVSGKPATAIQTSQLERNQLTTLTFDEPLAEGDLLRFEHHSITPIETEIRRSWNDFFSGFNVLYTMQKDEELEWISDWAKYYSRIHNVNSVLIFDNGSSKYSLTELRDVVDKIPEIERVAVINWPFKYGPQGGSWDGKDAPWDSDFCQIGAFQTARFRFLARANGMVNADIDELVVPLTKRTLFDSLAESDSGVIGYGGHWIENSSGDISVNSLPRFWEHALTKDRDAPCAAKWTGAPERWPDRAQPTAHFVRNIDYLPSPDFYTAHFRALNSGWKSTERLATVTTEDLSIDKPLYQSMKVAFNEDASHAEYPSHWPSEIADMHQYRQQTWLRSEINRLSEQTVEWNKRWLWRYLVPVFEVMTDIGQVAFDFHIDDTHVRLAVAVRQRKNLMDLRNRLQTVAAMLDETSEKHMGFWISSRPYSPAQDSTWSSNAMHFFEQMKTVLSVLTNSSTLGQSEGRRSTAKTEIVASPLNNLRSDSEFEELANRIIEHAGGRTILYVPNQGNWGDALIHKGTVQFFDFFKIKYKIGTRNEVVSFANQLARFGSMCDNLVLATGGGGSWRNENSGNYKFFSSAVSRFSKAVVLPHTFEYAEVPGMSDRVLYAARDSTLSKESIGDSITCHDMAFFLQLPSLLKTNSTNTSAALMRNDPERHPSATNLGPGFDLSGMGNHFSQITPFFQILQQFAHVSTDRMHVAIAGAMLGIDVDLYPGNYGKANAVYHHTIQRFYPNVRIQVFGRAFR